MRQTNDELYDVTWRAQFMSGVIMPAMFLIGNLGYVLVAVVGGPRVATGSLSLGAVQAFIQYSHITTMTREDLRSRVGMVLQDTWLFEGTIAENIAYGRPHASREDVLAAAAAAYVDRFVQHLPDGYDTVLDDGASTVSAGERQLITIARAFVAQPSLLILS